MTTLLSLLGAILLVVPAAAFAVPTPSSLPRQEADAHGGVSPLAESQITTFKPYTHFASTAYCLPATTANWSCGHNCEANPNFKPIASGGDGVFVQFWYVGYDPDLNEVIVAHQGTDVLTIVPVLEDVDILPLPLDPKIFPGIPEDALVHNGFAIAQAETSQFVLTAVKNAMQEFGTNKVTTTGHSLGAAISLLDAVFLHLQLQNATVRYVGYGLPRVGYEPFVDFVDRLGFEVNHIANKKDLVPILPPRLLGYRHISGEIHIDEANQWMNCPGHDNISPFCTVGDVNLLLDFNIIDHVGPYDGVLIGFMSPRHKMPPLLLLACRRLGTGYELYPGRLKVMAPDSHRMQKLRIAMSLNVGYRNAGILSMVCDDVHAWDGVAF